MNLLRIYTLFNTYAHYTLFIYRACAILPYCTKIKFFNGNANVSKNRLSPKWRGFFCCQDLSETPTVNCQLKKLYTVYCIRCMQKQAVQLLQLSHS